MLKDIKMCLETDETKKMLLSRDLRENSKRIRNLSGSQKKIQDQLKIKEDKLKDAIEDKKKFEVEVKTWQKECREAAQRTGGLERKVAELQGRLAGSDQHLERERLRRTNLQLSCNKLINENNMKDEFVEKLKTEVFHFSNVASSRESEFKDLQRQNNELRRVISQSRRMSQLSRREEVQQVQQAGGRSGAGELDRATEDFLDRVSTVSRSAFWPSGLLAFWSSGLLAFGLLVFWPGVICSPPQGSERVGEPEAVGAEKPAEQRGGPVEGAGRQLRPGRGEHSLQCQRPHRAA
jgi:chromosome segregation ATPase